MKNRMIVAGLYLVGVSALFLTGCGPAHTPASMEQAASSRSQIVGIAAPDFTLPDQNDKPVTLSQLRGQWVVLYFYPADDTPGCTCEATEFTKTLKEFKRMNAKVYGISPDSPTSHRSFIAGYKLQIDLLSDPDHKVMTEYGAWVQAAFGPKTYGRVIRTTMIMSYQSSNVRSYQSRSVRIPNEGG